MNISAIRNYVFSFAIIIVAPMLAYRLWANIQFDNALAESLNNSNIEALQDAENLIVYKNISQLINEGKLKEAESLLRLFINKEEKTLNTRILNTTLKPETITKLKELLVEADKQ